MSYCNSCYQIVNQSRKFIHERTCIPAACQKDHPHKSEIWQDQSVPAFWLRLPLSAPLTAYFLILKCFWSHFYLVWFLKIFRNVCVYAFWDHWVIMKCTSVLGTATLSWGLLPLGLPTKGSGFRRYSCYAPFKEMVMHTFVLVPPVVNHFRNC